MPSVPSAVGRGNWELRGAAVGVLGLRVESKPDGRASALPFNPLVVLRAESEREGHVTTLDEFLEANRDGLTLAEVQSICDHLCGGRVYHGGGGASEGWTLERMDR